MTYLALRLSTPESLDPHASRRIDWLGLATIGSAIFALLFALTAGAHRGLVDPLVVVLLAGSVLHSVMRGYDALEAGLLVLPATVGIFAFIPRGTPLGVAVLSGLSGGFSTGGTLAITGLIVLVTLLAVRLLWPEPHA